MYNIYIEIKTKQNTKKEEKVCYLSIIFTFNYKTNFPSKTNYMSLVVSLLLLSLKLKPI